MCLLRRIQLLEHAPLMHPPCTHAPMRACFARWDDIARLVPAHVSDQPLEVAVARGGADQLTERSLQGRRIGIKRHRLRFGCLQVRSGADQLAERGLQHGRVGVGPWRSFAGRRGCANQSTERRRRQNGCIRLLLQQQQLQQQQLKEEKTITEATSSRHPLAKRSAPPIQVTHRQIIKRTHLPRGCQQQVSCKQQAKAPGAEKQPLLQEAASINADQQTPVQGWL